MATKEELEAAVLDAFKARYGGQEDLGLPKLQYNGKIPNHVDAKGNVIDYTPYHHWQIWYLDDDGAVKEKPLYAYSPDDVNFMWHDTDPTKLPPKPSTEETFAQKLQKKIKVLITDGTIDYGEIIRVDEDLQRARVFIKDATKEAVYIVGIDADGNLIKKETNFDK